MWLLAVAPGEVPPLPEPWLPPLQGVCHFWGALQVQVPSEWGMQSLLLAVHLDWQQATPDQVAVQPLALAWQEVVYHWTLLMVPPALKGSWQAQPVMNWVVPLLHGAVVFQVPPE